MTERLTVSGATTQRDIDRLLELSNDNQFGRNEAYYKLQQYEDLGFTPEEIAIMAKFYREQTSVEAITADMKIVAKIIKLDKYEKLEEEGRLIILPEDMDLKKLIKCTDGDGLCPRDVGLTDRCELSCLECWLAALKGGIQ